MTHYERVRELPGLALSEGEVRLVVARAIRHRTGDVRPHDRRV
ncbi:hypothetical protein BN903_25 [Halorubrum sp. AJ67]|nr:hypothetical protein BN903_25 [Halorubrum sp. AJ67]